VELPRGLSWWCRAVDVDPHARFPCPCAVHTYCSPSCRDAHMLTHAPHCLRPSQMAPPHARPS
jgi:hypothetical protein